MQHVIKQEGHTEPFDVRKIERACLRACYNTHLNEPQAQKICKSVSESMRSWLGKRTAVTTEDVFDQVTLLLNDQHKDVAFMFRTHRDIN